MRFKIGDKVRVKTNLDCDKYENFIMNGHPLGWNYRMRDFEGKTFEIIEIDNDYWYGLKLREEYIVYYFLPEDLENREEKLKRILK